MNKTKGHEPGSFACHEVLHMTSFLIDAVDEELVGHPAIKSNEEWLRLSTVALEALHDLYQSIGSKHFEAA